MAPIPLPVESLTGNVPVYTDRNWWYDASAFYAAPGGTNPVGIHVKPRYVMPLKKLARGQYPRTINAFQAVRVLANELAHANGAPPDPGGFDGGTLNRPTIMRYSKMILQASGAPKSYQRWALKRISRAQGGTITGPGLVVPQPPPAPTGPLPIIGL